ncbi:hypothetical protein [Streptomyces sp. NPDC008139]
MKSRTVFLPVRRDGWTVRRHKRRRRTRLADPAPDLGHVPYAPHRTAG